MTGFKIYNKEELFKMIDNISIERVDNLIITKYYNRIINTTIVSNRYEIFDITKYLKEKINTIEQNFPIYKYRLVIKGGKQSLQLVSEKIEIGGVDFHKSFYILNSTDKSRRLSFNTGLKSDSKGFYVVGNNVSLTKKHLKGVTKAAEEASGGLNGETFDDQIKSITSLLGHRIKLSKIREVILGDLDNIPDINHRKFDAFKNVIRWPNSGFKVSNSQRNLLSTQSTNIKRIDDDLDFFIDAFSAFQAYLTIFNRQDAHIVKNETERIMKMTQWSVRNSILESLGI